MKFEKLFLRLLDAMVLLGALAYSVADEDLTHAAIALPLVICAAMLTGGEQGSPLPRWLINTALLSATGYMGMSWLNDPSDTVGVLSRYVIWLQIIKLFEPRTPRDQAQVIALSVMLTIGACLTSVSPDLGAVLILYVPTLLMTVIVFQLVSSQKGAGGAVATGSRPASDLRKFGAFSGSLITLIAISVFIVTPRGLGEAVIGGWSGPAPKPTIGFRDHVQLGAQGLLSESRNIIMEMSVESSREPGSYGKPLLLRGAVLDEYDATRGLWRRSSALSSARSQPQRWRRGDGLIGDPTATELTTDLLLTQRILCVEQPAELFSAWRPIGVSFEDHPKSVPMRWNHNGGLIGIAMSSHVGSFRYTVVSNPSKLTPSRTLPSLERRIGVRLTRRWIQPTRAYSVKPTDDAAPHNPFRLGPIRELAERILSDRRIDLTSDSWDIRERAAAAFRTYLQQNYSYTTEMLAPAPGLDPIESFLFDTAEGGRGGRGHCEYFASALAALCQSVEIPARVVTGFAASEFDPATGLFTIRQNHAHAWVDVEIAWRSWREMDPSPTAEIARLHRPEPGPMAWVRKALDFAQLAWIRSIITYDRGSQSAALRSAREQPIAAFSALNKWVADRIGEKSSDEPAGENLAATAARVFATVLVSSTLLALMFFALVARGGALIRLICRWLRVRPPKVLDRLQDPGVKELRRLLKKSERHMARAGLARSDSTPALRHAESLSQRDEELSRAAQGLARMYYAARFGARLPDRQAVASARQLARTIRVRLQMVSIGGVPAARPHAKGDHARPKTAA